MLCDKRQFIVSMNAYIALSYFECNIIEAYKK